MTPAQLSRTVLHAVRRAVESGRLGTGHGSLRVPECVAVDSPPRRGDGDYGISVAFQIAKAAGTSPYDVARVLRSELEGQDGVGSVEIAGAGFLNVTLDDRARAALVAELALTADDEPGEGDTVDAPATDIDRWSAATGEAPAALTVRTARSSSLFHVQYAHARTRALSRNAHDLGFHSDPRAATVAGTDDRTPRGADDPRGTDDRTPYAAGPHGDGPHGDDGQTDPSPYGTRARTLLALLADHRRISEQGDPGRQARHLVAVGDAFFDFHDHCPTLPSGDEKPGAAHRARLALVEATGAVLAGGLSQLGVTAPAHL